MKIEHTETRPDGGGNLTVTAYTPTEKQAALKHFNRDTDPMEFALIITDPEPLTIVQVEGGRDNYAWFQIDSCLELDFSEPYFREYVKRTGDVGRGILPDLDLTPAFPWQGLMHTHYMREIRTEHGHLCFSTIVHACNWNGMEAAEYAEKMAIDYVQQDVGTRRHEPEYISHGDHGLMKRNPAYLRRHACTPALSAQWLFSALCDHWLSTVANDEQRELVEADRALMYANHRGEGSLKNITGYGDKLRRSWDAETVPWAALQSLGVATVAVM